MPSIPDVLRNVYFGPDYSPQEMEQELERSGRSYTAPESIEREMAKLLADGHVVARFDGRMECGPRPLGNRSILYQPADPSVNEQLNEGRRRTEFMSFAPSTLIEYARDFYLNHRGAQEAARFMTITFVCTDWMKRTCPGVVHVDGPARPQLIERNDNASYYRHVVGRRRLRMAGSFVLTVPGALIVTVVFS